jgi:hypothetical protein
MVLLWCDCYKAEFCLLCNCPDVELGPSTYTNYSLPLFGGGGDIGDWGISGGCNRRGD